MFVPGIVATECTVLIGVLLLALSVDDSSYRGRRFLSSECSESVLNSRVVVRSRESAVASGARSTAEVRATFSPRMKRRCLSTIVYKRNEHQGFPA